MYQPVTFGLSVWRAKSPHWEGVSSRPRTPFVIAASSVARIWVPSFGEASESADFTSTDFEVCMRLGGPWWCKYVGRGDKRGIASFQNSYQVVLGHDQLISDVEG